MKIVQLNAENVKRLRAVEITPDGNVVVIAGRNAQGKSSVLDSIWFALGGGAAQKGTSKPIRDGETDAMVRLDMGDIIVTRTWTGDKTSLKVESADGAKYSSPQGMLDQLVGRLSFDPLAFSMQDEKKQLADLLALVDLPFDPEQLDGKRRAIFDERTDVGRRGVQLKGQLDGMAVAPEGTPDDEVSVGDLLAELRAMQNAARANDEIQRQHRVAVQQAEAWQQKVDLLAAQLAEARGMLASCQTDAAALGDKVASLIAVDTTELEHRISNVEETNRAVRAKQERAQVATAVSNTRAQYDELTARIEAIDVLKREGVAAAKFPVDGLGFDQDGVTYQGVPFRQCSAAERLRVSLAMAIALNPKLRVIRITDGSLLDSENMRLIEEMAQASDYQVWIERVDESGTVGVIIEDGAVAS
jgi:hypothetical protein